MKAFTEHMGASCKDADLDNDPLTGEYGSEEEKVTLYHEGVPEIMGKRTVGKLFEGERKTFQELVSSPQGGLLVIVRSNRVKKRIKLVGGAKHRLGNIGYCFV